MKREGQKFMTHSGVVALALQQCMIISAGLKNG
jgi:hypothetical protein